MASIYSLSTFLLSALPLAVTGVLHCECLLLLFLPNCNLYASLLLIFTGGGGFLIAGIVYLLGFFHRENPKPISGIK